jgi:hypothetical protein
VYETFFNCKNDQRRASEREMNEIDGIAQPHRASNLGHLKPNPSTPGRESTGWLSLTCQNICIFSPFLIVQNLKETMVLFT